MRHLPNIIIKSFHDVAVDGYPLIKSRQEYHNSQRPVGAQVSHVNPGVLNGLLALLRGEVQVHTSGNRISVTQADVTVTAQTNEQLHHTWNQVTNAQEACALHIAESALLLEDPTHPWWELIRKVQANGYTLPLSRTDLEHAKGLCHILMWTCAHVEARLLNEQVTLIDEAVVVPRKEVTSWLYDPNRERPVYTAVASPLVNRIARWIRQGENILLTGPTATFKTTSAIQATVLEKASLVMVGGRPGLEDRDLFGGLYPSEKGAPEWVDGPVTLAFAQASAGTKTVLLLNELTRFEPMYLGAMIGALDDTDERGLASMGITGVPAGRYYALRLPNGELIYAPTEHLSVIGTTNLGQDYITAQALDAALMRRFNRHVEVPYADEEQALKVILASCPDDHLARITYQLEVHSREQVPQSGSRGDGSRGEEGLLAREMNPSVSAALAKETHALIHEEGLEPEMAFFEAAQTTAVPYCVPRMASGALEPAARERFEDLIREYGARL